MKSGVCFAVLPLMALLLAGAGALPTARAAIPAPDVQPLDAEKVGRGRYLARITGCNDCHTDGYFQFEGRIPEDKWLTGASFGWRGPWGTTYGSNLRIFVKALTEEQWVIVARNLRTRPPMPWFNLNAMNEADLQALYQFIHFLEPTGYPAPSYVPPDQEPATPHALFPLPSPPEGTTPREPGGSAK